MTALAECANICNYKRSAERTIKDIIASKCRLAKLPVDKYVSFRDNRMHIVYVFIIYSNVLQVFIKDII